jgi:hypothetical protein
MRFDYGHGQALSLPLHPDTWIPPNRYGCFYQVTGHEANHCLLLVQNTWSFTSMLPYAFTVWCLNTEILTLSYMLTFENVFAVTSLQSVIIWLTHTKVASDSCVPQKL